MSNNISTSFRSIADIEAELDRVFPVDEVIERYFTPLETSSELTEYEPLTLGKMLLTVSDNAYMPFLYEDIIGFYRSASPERIAKHFSFVTVNTFYADEEIVSTDMSALAQFADDYLVRTEDKWAFIDVVINPLKHLESLRKTVCDIAEYIREHWGNHSAIKIGIDSFELGGGPLANIKEIIGSEPKDDEVCKSCTVYQSLLDYSMYSAIKSEDGRLDIIVGVYVGTALEMRRNGIGITGINRLLKLLSDPTRFAVLHELCGKYSYGLELAEKFGGTRSAMYYHLEKLAGFGLIELKMTDYRMLYTMNKQQVYDKLTAMRDYLLDGWKPGEQ